MYKNAADVLRSKSVGKVKVGLILGSGLGGFAESGAMEVKARVKYEEIEGFPRSTVKGHAGQFVYGTVGGVDVLCMQGRFHLYEGWDTATVAIPVRMMKELGAETLIVTNAAGGVNTEFLPGDLMLITDHINFTGRNPLVGENDEAVGPRFPDMSAAYDKALRAKAIKAAEGRGISLKQGVYAMMLGPSFETPAEIRMLRTLGADAVGMSTVPEVVAARHAGLSVLGISLISNCAAGILDQPLSHTEVMEAGEKAQAAFTGLMRDIISSLNLGE